MRGGKSAKLTEKAYYMPFLKHTNLQPYRFIFTHFSEYPTKLLTPFKTDLRCSFDWLQESSRAVSPTDDTADMLDDSGEDGAGDDRDGEAGSRAGSEAEASTKNGISVSVRKPSVVVDEPASSHTIRTTVRCFFALVCADKFAA